MGGEEVATKIRRRQTATRRDAPVVLGFVHFPPLLFFLTNCSKSAAAIRYVARVGFDLMSVLGPSPESIQRRRVSGWTLRRFAASRSEGIGFSEVGLFPLINGAVELFGELPDERPHSEACR